MPTPVAFHTPIQTPGASVTVYRTPHITGLSDFATWVKPRGVSMLSIFCLGAGGGGGAGNLSGSDQGTDGCGGGGSGGVGTLIIPAFLVPDVLIVHVGSAGAGAIGSTGSGNVSGGFGGVSYVSISPCLWTTPEEILMISSSTEAGGGPGGNSSGAGLRLGGAIGTISNAVLATMGTATWRQGGDGGTAGLKNATLPGSPVMSATLPFTGGGGGAGINTTGTVVNAGGSITGSGTFATVAGGAASAGIGLLAGDGLLGVFNRMFGLQYSPSTFGMARACGGSGAGSTRLGGLTNTSGATGGSGGPGCGGGGGGAVTQDGSSLIVGNRGGYGGRGGAGVVIITAW